MKINKTTIKILVCSRQEVNTNISVDNVKLGNVNSLTFSGRKVTSNGKIVTDIDCRIAHAKQVFFKNK